MTSFFIVLVTEKKEGPKEPSYPCNWIRCQARPNIMPTSLTRSAMTYAITVLPIAT